MFAEARVRLGTRDLEERSITAWLRQHVPDVASLWPEAPLTASWFDWRRRIGADHVEALDEAWQSACRHEDLPAGASTPSQVPF